MPLSVGVSFSAASYAFDRRAKIVERVVRGALAAPALRPTCIERHAVGRVAQRRLPVAALRVRRAAVAVQQVRRLQRDRLGVLGDGARRVVRFQGGVALGLKLVGGRHS